MYSAILSIAATLLHLHLVFASPSPLVDTSVPANGLMLIDSTNIDSVDCAENDTACSANRSLIGQDFIGVCGPGFRTKGVNCVGETTLISSCLTMDNEYRGSHKETCRPGWACVQTTTYDANCLSHELIVQWGVFPPVPGSMVVWTKNITIPSYVTTNYYYASSGIPARVVYTIFVAQFRNGTTAEVGRREPSFGASSDLIDWYNEVERVSIQVIGQEKFGEVIVLTVSSSTPYK